MPLPPNVINVPRPERGSYNPNRSAGLLLKSQALHFQHALMQRRKELDAVLAIELSSLKTEGDVSNYVQKASAILHTYVEVSPRK